MALAVQQREDDWEAPGGTADEQREGSSSSSHRARRGAVVATASAVVSTAAHGSPRTAAPAGRRLVARSSFSRDGSNAATRRDPARVHAGRAKQNRGNIATDMQVQPHGYLEHGWDHARSRLKLSVVLSRLTGATAAPEPRGMSTVN
ncbi:unnamed protein product [Lampetra planeri]